VDGVEVGAKYDWIRNAIFSPDSRHVAYVAWRGHKELIVVDGSETEEYDGFLSHGRLIFDSSRQLHALAHRGADILRIQVEIAAPPSAADAPALEASS
jgi:hypothetical protein